MQILSHRGYWKEDKEKNTELSFRNSFKLGFGTETDIRDYNGKLVISHDIPTGSEMLFEDFLKLYSEYDINLPLALNIKSDGLQIELKKLLEKYMVFNYFLFDMSVPDALSSIKYQLKCFTRQSEYELEPSFYEISSGVWIDCFQEDWINEEIIKKHLDNDKLICIVSPELHRRKYLEVWKRYNNMGIIKSSNILLCTDLPEEAKNLICNNNLYNE